MENGIIIDVGFQADIKSFINSIDKQLADIDFNDKIKLSDAFEKQAGEVRKKIKELNTEINNVLNGKVDNGPVKQINELQKSVNNLKIMMKALQDSMPSDMATKYSSSIREMSKQTGQMVEIISSAKDALKSLSDISGGDIRLINTDSLRKQQSELQLAYKNIREALTNIENALNGYGINKSGHIRFSSTDEIVNELGNLYTQLIEMQEQFFDASESNNQILSRSTGTMYANYLATISRYINEFQKMGGKMSTVVDEIFTPDGNHYSVQKLQNEIGQYFSEIKTYLLEELARLKTTAKTELDFDLDEVFTQQKAKSGQQSIKVPMDISTKGSTLGKQALDVITTAQEYVNSKGGMQVQVSFINANATVKNQKTLDNIQSSLANIDDAKVKQEISNLISSVQQSIDSQLVFDVKVNAKQASQDVKDFISEAKALLQDLSVNTKLYPKVQLEQSSIDDLKAQLYAVSQENLVVDFSSEINALTQLYSYFDVLSQKITQINADLKGLPEKVTVDIDILKGQNLENITTKTIQDLAQAQKAIADALTIQAQRNTETSIIDKEKIISELRSLSEEMNNSFKINPIDGITSDEISKLSSLRKAVDDVTTAVENKTKAFETEANVVSKSVNAETSALSPLNKLESAFSQYKKFYDTNSLATESGAKAALAYYEAYQEALLSKLNKSDLKKNTIGNTNTLFSGNYLDYKDGIGKLDISGLTSQIKKWQAEVDKFNNPEVVNAINQITKAIQKMLNAGNSSDATTQFLTKLNQTINNLSNEKGANKIQALTENLKKFRDSIQELDKMDTNGFVSSLSSILEKGDQLKALGTVLQSTQKQINAAAKALNDSTNLSNSGSFLANNSSDILKAVQTTLSSDKTIITQEMKATKEGLVQVVALVQDATGAYEKFTYAVDENLNVMQRGWADGNNPVVQKMAKQVEAFQQLRDITKNLGQNTSEFTFNSSNWQQIIDKASEFGIEAENIIKVVRNIDEQLNESFQIFTKFSRITIGMDSEGILYQKNIFDADKLQSSIESQIDNIKQSLSSAFKGDSLGLEKAINGLKNLQATWGDAKKAVDGGLISKDVLTQLENYITAFQGDIEKLSITNLFDRAKSKNSTSDFISQIEEAQNRLTQLNAIIDKVKTNQPITSDDINFIKNFTTNISSLNKGLTETDNRFASTTTVEKWAQRIQHTLNESTAMPQNIRSGYQEILNTFESLNMKVPADQFEQLKTKTLELNYALEKTGKTGKSFLDRFNSSVIAQTASQLARMYLSVFSIIRYVKSAVTTIKELDTAMVDLQKTTAMNSRQLEEFYQNASEVAKETGVTTEEIINQAAAWSRLGYNSKEASETMAKLSSQFAAISPDMDVDEATDGLVSVMKAFDIGSEDVLDGIMSKINIIGNTAATTNGEIVTMLEKSSSSMKEANNTLEETIALETAAVEITRDADSVGG